MTTTLDQFVPLETTKSIYQSYYVGAKAKLYVVYAGNDVTFKMNVTYEIEFREGGEYEFKGYLLQN